ncbi:MAG: PorT family protein [Bernardetiaceae bacterium]|nr:PorT family protein [Bernardetiaceae bacterium]
MALWLPRLAQAQEPPTQGWLIGFRAGANLMQLREQDTNLALENSSVPGFQLGVVARCSLAPRWVFQPGLHFVRRGGTTRLGTIELRGGISYLELPLGLAYRVARLWPTGPNQRAGLWLGAAPYAAVALGGFYSANGNRTAIEFGSAGTLQRWDVGLKLGLQIHHGKWELQSGYDWGLLDVSNVPGRVARNRGVYGSLALYLGRI